MCKCLTGGLEAIDKLQTVFFLYRSFVEYIIVRKYRVGQMQHI